MGLLLLRIIPILIRPFIRLAFILKRGTFFIKNNIRFIYQSFFDTLSKALKLSIISSFEESSRRAAPLDRALEDVRNEDNHPESTSSASNKPDTESKEEEVQGGDDQSAGSSQTPSTNTTKDSSSSSIPN